jgi:hypothetical protein
MDETLRGFRGAVNAGGSGPQRVTLAGIRPHRALSAVLRPQSPGELQLPLAHADRSHWRQNGGIGAVSWRRRIAFLQVRARRPS